MKVRKFILDLPKLIWNTILNTYYWFVDLFENWNLSGTNIKEDITELLIQFRQFLMKAIEILHKIVNFFRDMINTLMSGFRGWR